MIEQTALAVYTRRKDVVLRETAGEHILVPIRNGAGDLPAIFVLNRLGLRIWELLDEGHTLEAILANVLEHYDVDPVVAQADINAYLERLLDVELVERRG